MHRGIRSGSVTIAFALLLSIVGSRSDGALIAPGVNMQRVDSTVLGELNSVEGSMGAIYQALLDMLKQSFEMKKDRLEEAKVQSEQKRRAAQEATDAKKREIEEKSQAAKGAWNTAFVAAMSSCTAIVGEVATTSDSIQALYGAPDEQRVQRFATNADVLKKKLTKLNGEVNRLRDMLNSGKIDSVPKDDLEKLKTQFDNSLQQLRNTKRFTLEMAKKRRGE